MKTLLTLALAAVLTPVAASAQQADLHRQSYTFIDNRLDLVVVADAPGVLQLVRGERGRVEVASRSAAGLAGAGLGGTYTRQLRLAAAGTSAVEYIVVVPEHVSVRVHLPEGVGGSLSPSAAAATYRWGASPGFDAGQAPHSVPAAPTATGPASAAPASPAPVLVYAGPFAPPAVNVSELSAIRSISLRVEGGEFRISSSRPLLLETTGSGALELRTAGEAVDLVIQVPRAGPAFSLQSGATRLAEASGGQARALCGNVVVQNPSSEQVWLTFRPQSGRLDCR